MNYIARKVPAAAPLPGGGPAASVLLRGRRRRDGRYARQARGRRHLGKPVGDVQIAGPGGARAGAARGAGRGDSADRRGGAPRGRVTRPRVGVPGHGRIGPSRRGPDRRGGDTRGTGPPKTGKHTSGPPGHANILFPLSPLKKKNTENR